MELPQLATFSWIEISRKRETDAAAIPAEPLRVADSSSLIHPTDESTAATTTGHLDRSGQAVATNSSPIHDQEESIEELIEDPIAVPIEASTDELDDHHLISRIREGDEFAFQELVRRYRNPITNYVYRMIDDYDRAVDLSQETFVRVYMSVERYQATYSFSTYIYRIAHNLAITELRQRKRRRLIPLPTFFSDKESEEIEVELPDDRQIQADAALIADERRAAVTRAIASLPEKYRAPLVLCDLEEKSYDEIAEVLGLPTGTVKSRINRARNLLKEKLRDFI
ncbi:MAG: RNA polymerase sigma factor [Blastocatellia bacterium]|jgi:RNA polymerase sigma-70 factor (ECF subfamily)